MANEPERPIEKVLRAAAKKRGDEAGGAFDLHPAMRQVLQGEVTRKFAKEAPAEKPQAFWLNLLLPRLAWTAAICIALGLIVWMILPRGTNTSNESAVALNSHREEMPANAPVPPASTPSAALDSFKSANRSARTEADRKPSHKSETENEIALAPVPPLASVPNSIPEVAPGEMKKPGTVGEDIIKADKNPVASTLQPAAKDSIAKGTASTNEFYAVNTAAPVAAETRALTPTAPGTPPPPTDMPAKAAPAPVVPGPAAFGGAPSAASEKGPQAAIAGFKQNRSESLQPSADTSTSGAATEGAIPPRQTVLASFRVEQQGSQLRIIDADGSVYTGYVQPATASAKRRSSNSPSAPPAATAHPFADDALNQSAPPAAASVPPAPSARQDYTFRVTGTNLTLHKKVVFKGNLTTVTNLDLLKTTTNSFGNFLGISGVAGQPQPLANSRVAGKFTVGGGKEIEVQANPANP